MEDILIFGEQRPNTFYASYPFDWNKIFSPIEKQAWQAIKCKGGIVLYPQFPVGRFFVDFGNPYLKIALELDGKEFHSAERDIIRDSELKELGWTVYRVPGSEMYSTNYLEWYDMDVRDISHSARVGHIYNWFMNTGDGVIEAIKIVHFNGSSYHDCAEELAKESLDKHKLI